MTTLPQTTATVRLPRPPGAIQGVPGGPVAVGIAPAAAMSGADVRRVIRSNLWLIAGLLVLSAIAGYGINRLLEAKFPKYTATCFVQIVPQRPINPLLEVSGGMPPDQLAIEQQSQAVAMRSDTLLQAVLSSPESEVRKTSWFNSFSGSLQEIREDFFNNYTVEALAGTRLLKVSFSYSNPKECQTIVYEVVNTHIEAEQQKAIDELHNDTVELTNKKMKLEDDVSKNSQKLVTWRQTIESDGGSVSGFSIKAFEMQEKGQELTKTQLTAQVAKEQYDALIAQINAGATPPEVEMLVETNPTVLALRARVQQYDMYLQELSLSSGPKNVNYLKQQAVRDQAQKQLDDELTTARINAITLVTAKEKSLMDATATEAAEMQKGLDKVKEAMVDLNQQTHDYLILESETTAMRLELGSIKEKLDNTNAKFIQKNQTKVQWVSRPTLPTTPTFPRLSLVMCVSIGVGLALGLGIAFLREMTDQTVRSPRDIARVGQMSLLGMVADESDDPQAAGARLPLVIFDAPHSMTAEQLRQVRTRLQHAASLDTTRSIMVTSPSPGDGKTTIACNLSAGLALNGRRILLVDANFRRPEIHRIFAVANDQGFSDVLNGTVAFDEVVQETQVPNLSIMTSGPRPINATEIFESQLLIDFIERALEEFDHVIFDSGPLMVVSESVAMAPRVDGVISVVRARGNSRGLLGRMRDGLRQIKAEHLGVVLNAVRAQGGGYYRRNIQTYYEYNG